MMRIWGKLAGALFGYMLAGPLGVFVGLILGHFFDRGLSLNLQPVQPTPAVQEAFFKAAFQMMGHLAKSDGRVHEDEIGFAKAVMDRMSLDETQRQAAIRLFYEGKDPAFPFEQVLVQLRQVCRGRHALLRMFLEIQLQVAYADGVLHPSEQALLQVVGERLGISRFEFLRLEAMVRAAAGFRTRAPGESSGPRDLTQAFDVLGVSPNASDAEVKRAYRRLMSQHHPDKLVARGLPEEMMRLAKEKTQEVQRAYETIRKARQAAPSIS